MVDLPGHLPQCGVACMQSGLYVGKSRSSAAPQTVVHLRYRWLPIGDNLWSPMTGTGLSASGICGTLGSQLRHLHPPSPSFFRGWSEAIDEPCRGQNLPWKYAAT